VCADATFGGGRNELLDGAVARTGVHDQEGGDGCGLPGLERWAERLMRPSGAHSIMPLMDERGTLHQIQDDLSETWVEEWAEDGVGAIEGYLAKHLAFLSFLDES